MVFAVTMNSKRNALLALMIATNFVELKGQVYKRTDTNKLWALACQVCWRSGSQGLGFWQWHYRCVGMGDA